MAYYLMIEAKKNIHQELPIENSKIFTKLTNYRKTGACSLKEIDLYTTMFYDEQELRKSLYEEGILSPELINKSLSIRTIQHGVRKKVPYDFLYQKDLEYLMNPNKLIAEINQRNLDNDFLFIKNLAEKFQSCRDCNATASELKHHANASLNTNHRSKYLDERDRQGDNLVVRFLKLLIFNYDQKPTGEIIYYNSIKYSNLHHLIAYMNNYNNKHQEKKSLENSNTSQLSLFDTNKPLTKTKTKNEKRTTIDGQFSMFDE
ncbi:MAG: hypothetical protein ACI4WU_04245 [Bacilli bacterium]